jgi:hypothetical protein
MYVTCGEAFGQTSICELETRRGADRRAHHDDIEAVTSKSCEAMSVRPGGVEARSSGRILGTGKRRSADDTGVDDSERFEQPLDA